MSTDEALVKQTLGEAVKLEGESVLWTVFGKVSRRVHHMSKAKLLYLSYGFLKGSNETMLIYICMTEGLFLYLLFKTLHRPQMEEEMDLEHVQ